MPSSQAVSGDLAIKPEFVDQKSPMASTSEPNRNPKYDPKKPHITDTPITKANWYKHVNWLNVVFIIGIPLAGCIAAFWTPLKWQTALWAVVYYFWTGLGITAGYHRLWAHKSYNASLPLSVFLALVGGGAVEGSIRWWSRDHRAHHRYTDTNKDPYSVRKGLLYSHLGWMVMKQNPKRIGRTDITDLNEDPVVVWQHKNYIKVVVFMGLIFPSAVAGLLWNDWKGGFIYAGILRIFFVQQATFCVNSLAHWLGDQPFDDRNSPRDHVITALVTLGEGYHNFHHEFPSDYRNAIEWHQYDPTKWSIWMWSKLGLASNLKQFRANEIEKGRVQQLQKKIDQKRSKLDWGVPLEQLPVIEWDDYVEQAKNGRGLIAVAGVVHDVTDFINEHPGFDESYTLFQGQIDKFEVKGPKEELVKGFKNLDWFKSSWDMYNSTRKIDILYEPLWALNIIFPDIYPWGMIYRGHDELRRTMDNAMYTFESKLLKAHEENESALNEGKALADRFKAEVLADYQYDGKIRTIEWYSHVLRAIIMPPFEAVAGPATDALLSPLSDAIPEPMKQFIDPQQMFTDLLDSIVMACIKTVVSSGQK